MSGSTKTSSDFSFKAVGESSTITGLLRSRALYQPEQPAYTFLLDGETERVSLCYRELDQQARRIAGLLQAHGVAAEPVLLLYPPGLEYIAAFFGCLYAGALAVPVYPPKANRTLHRLQSIVTDTRARIALTMSSILFRVQPLLTQHADLAGLRWLTTDGDLDHLTDEWQEPDETEETLALLQYTSGSTGQPKGVMLTHRNLLHNSTLLRRAFEYDSDSRCVSWLPVYHDMGLIGGVIQPLYGGFHCTLMSPVSFLQRPIRWLKAISDDRATISGGPDFAYHLCLSRITPEQRAELDLSSWNTAFTGSEPVRSETVERFAETFAPCGFRKQFFYPCYGLAEATLIVSGGKRGNPPTIKTVRARALENNRLVEAVESDAETRRLVSCGRPLLDQKIMIVHPETLMACAPGEIGEVWVSGDSVARGYWNRGEETLETFWAYLADTEEGPFLRTGDLGVLHEGELFITGRLKDLIIIRGRNHYPQDIEWTVERCHAALRHGCGAAFSVDEAGEERLVILQEVENCSSLNLEIIIESIRQSVSEEHELQVYAVVLIKPRSLPKTSSGKIQRRTCRARFLEKTFEVVAESYAALPRANATSAISGAMSSFWRSEDIEPWLIAQLGSKLGLELSDIDDTKPLTSYGLDSLAVYELIYNVEINFGVTLSLASLLQSPSIRELANHLRAELQLSTKVRRPQHASTSEINGEHPLSHGQQALWFLYQLAPESAAYNLSVALRIEASLDLLALRSAFQSLVDRHPCLRTTFNTNAQGAPTQRIHEQMKICFQTEDAALWGEALLQTRMMNEVHRPFDLRQGPLLRVSVYTRSAQEHILLFVIHHIVADFWSFAVLMNELGSLYTAEKTGAPARLAPLALRYTDYVRWQAEMLSTAAGERLWSYWKNQLAGELPVLNLPTDRPRPPVQSYQGASQAFNLSEPLTRNLKALSRTSGTTLYVTLLAAFQTLLYRYTGQEDLLVGSLTAGRTCAELSGLVGYFVNPLVLRANVSGNPTFVEFLHRVRETVLAAFAHQDYPFALLVERLQPARDVSRSALFQTMFILQKAHLLDDEGLSSFALAEAGARLDLNGLPLESVKLDQRIAQFDLTLVMADTAGELRGSLEYNTDLFDAETIERMSAHFQTLLEAIAVTPQQRVSELPLLTPAERHQLLVQWNDTSVEYSHQICIHHLFEQQAALTPEAVALVFQEQQLTYQELNKRANQLAHHLLSRGLRTEHLVAILLDRSPDLLVTLLAVLKTGAAYLPLDSSLPSARLSLILDDASASLLLTKSELALQLQGPHVPLLLLDALDQSALGGSVENPGVEVTAENLAYVMYTSGTTGTPKGVMVSHGNVVNFLRGINERVWSDGEALSVVGMTKITFDISVLELLWPLTRGGKVLLMEEGAVSAISSPPLPLKTDRGMQFSLFYFATEDARDGRDQYKLLLEGATYADRHGFTAVWTPERHFHAFGGLYPNPSVVSAALATVTKQIQIRGGSVVLPLHHPIRVAEEWALVDNLSRGRVGIAFASGWHADDFVFFPENYPDRRELMFRNIEVVQRLWRGESIRVPGGSGTEIDVRVFPKPVQSELPVWITAAGNAETFEKAGKIGAKVLTHLLGQSVTEVAQHLKLYREALARHGHDPQVGHVTLMLHTFIGESRDAVKKKVAAPFINYLRSSFGLVTNLIRSLGLSFQPEKMNAQDQDDLLAFAFERYFETSALFGTPTTCMPMIERLKEIGIDEIACLIDFGLDTGDVLAGLGPLKELKERSNERLPDSKEYSLAAQTLRHHPSIVQSTPSLLKMLLLNSSSRQCLESLHTLLVGGEPLPPALVSQLRRHFSGRIFNMYGPTETTIWSSADLLPDEKQISIGRPLANTQLYILDQQQQPVPIGVCGELYIGGRGVARGYLGRAGLSAERFVPDHLSGAEGGRLYRTGDVARYLRDGRIEYVGRGDRQVKVRGHRVELGEVEAVLGTHAAVEQCAVVMKEVEGWDEEQMVGYVVMKEGRRAGVEDLKRSMRERVGEQMVPAVIVEIEEMPLTANGKVDQKALPRPRNFRSNSKAPYTEPRSKMEHLIAGIWREALGLERVGVHDNFFDLGGHSLLMAQVHTQLNEVLSQDLPLIKILEHPTIRSLALYLEREKGKDFSLQSSQMRAMKQRESLLRQKQSV